MRLQSQRLAILNLARRSGVVGVRQIRRGDGARHRWCAPQVRPIEIPEGFGVLVCEPGARGEDERVRVGDGRDLFDRTDEIEQHV